MSKQTSRIDTIRALELERVIAVIRLDEASRLVNVVDALTAGGIRAIEITVTTPGALDAVTALTRGRDGRALVGAGTVLDPDTARLAILAGARFVVAPTFNREVIEVCHRYDVVAVPGAYTPTEILTAWEAGADLVKVFPAGSLGPSFFSVLRGPLPQVRLMATGGVTAENVAEYLEAGVVAVGIGGAVIEKDAVARGDYARITEQARRLLEAVRQARERAP